MAPFAPAVVYPVGTTPLLDRDHRTVTGDGKPDLVTANVNSSNLSVLINSGSGTFAPAVNYAVGTSPLRIAIADLNGDGKLDLAVVNAYDVAVRLNNGDGTFAPPATTAPLAPVTTFGRDGGSERRRQARHPRPRERRRHRGSAAEQRRRHLRLARRILSHAAGKDPGSVTTADLNGDGKPDVLSVTNMNDTVGVLHQRQQRHDGRQGR